MYVPLRHPDTANRNVGEASRWLQDAVDRASRVVVHNMQYDLGWLSTDEVALPSDRTVDTQVAAVLLDENWDAYDLDSCCARAGVAGKDEHALREAAAAFGVDPKSEMWKLPARFVGPYAEQDARATLDLWRVLSPQLEEQDLGDAFRLEMDLVPMAVAMRRRGIRLDEGAADRATASLRQQRAAALEALRAKLGWRTIGMDDMMSPAALERAFVQENLDFPRTPKTRTGSFQRGWLEAHEHWLPRAVVAIRQLDSMAEKFIQTYLVGAAHLGRVHSEIHLLRDGTAGTRSYRLSYSDPPLQQTPARDPVMTPLVRGILLPERGEFWAAADYSQQEPRIGVHFASLCRCRGAEAAVDYYVRDPRADFHTMVAELTGLTRSQAKIINLGLMYGMGIAKLARSLGVSLEIAEEMVRQYHARMPWVRSLSEFASTRAAQRGHIRLLDGARCRFDLWEPRRREDRDRAPFRLAAARAHWGQEASLVRAGTHKAMNRLIQGSSARQTKLAMRECWRAGLLPLLQMHDELDFSLREQRQVDQVEEIMRDVVQLRIPMRVDVQLGRSWGEASDERKGLAPLTVADVLPC